jgi:hypothetical protein
LQEQRPFYELTAITFACVYEIDEDRLAYSDVGYDCNVLGHKDGEVSLTFAEMESLIRQGRLSRHSLLVHLHNFIGSEFFYSSCDEGDAILKDIVAAHIAKISASLYPGMPYSATHTATTGSHNCRVSVIPVRTAHCSIHTHAVRGGRVIGCFCRMCRL